jgi:hypothetical protein
VKGGVDEPGSADSFPVVETTCGILLRFQPRSALSLGEKESTKTLGRRIGKAVSLLMRSKMSQLSSITVRAQELMSALTKNCLSLVYSIQLIPLFQDAQGSRIHLQMRV